jgi:hypothetical protein
MISMYHKLFTISMTLHSTLTSHVSVDSYTKKVGVVSDAWRWKQMTHLGKKLPFSEPMLAS